MFLKVVGDYDSEQVADASELVSRHVLNTGIGLSQECGAASSNAVEQEVDASAAFSKKWTD